MKVTVEDLLGFLHSTNHDVSQVGDQTHWSASSSTCTLILRPLPFWGMPTCTSPANLHVNNPGVSTMICNLARFRPYYKQPGTGSPSSLLGSGFSGFVLRRVTLMVMWLHHTGWPKSASYTQKLRMVQHLLLTGMIILDYICRHPIHHTGHHGV